MSNGPEFTYIVPEVAHLWITAPEDRVLTLEMQGGSLDSGGPVVSVKRGNDSMATLLEVGVTVIKTVADRGSRHYGKPFQIGYVSKRDGVQPIRFDRWGNPIMPQDVRQLCEDLDDLPGNQRPNAAAWYDMVMDFVARQPNGSLAASDAAIAVGAVRRHTQADHAVHPRHV